MSDPDEARAHGSEVTVRAEAAYQALNQSTSDGLYAFRGTRCIDCYAKAAEILGWPIDRVLGFAPRELSPPTQRDGRDSRDKAREFMVRVQAGECLVFDRVHLRRDGSLVDVEVGLHSIDKGDEPYVVALLRDVSARKSAEDALRLSEEKFSKAFRASPDAMVIGSHEAGTDEINDSFLRMFGYTHDEVVGRTTFELGLWRDLEEYAALEKQLVRRESIRDAEVSLVTKSGETLTCLSSAEPIPVGERAFGVVIVRDIADQRRTEREKQNAFEEIARLKEELERERDYLREQVDVLRFGEIDGASASLRRVLAQVEGVASTNANVLVTGETGVGKEAHHPGDPFQELAGGPPSGQGELLGGTS